MPDEQATKPSTAAQPAASAATVTPVNVPPTNLNPPSQSTSSPVTQSPQAPASPVGTLGNTAPSGPPPTSPLAKPVPPSVNSNTTPQLDPTTQPPTKPTPVFIKDGAPIIPDKPSASASAPEIVAQAGAVQLKSDGSKLTAVTVDVNPQNPPTAAGYVKIIANPDGKPWAKFRGVCTKCGFQSFQPSEREARQMIEYHAGKHLLGQ